VPELNGQRLTGMQHKYRETVLFFPSQGQTCHAYCTYCFRWPQFVGLDELKFAMREVELLADYLRANPRASDVLFTGGDPMIMKARNLAAYIEPLLAEDLDSLHTIRIGTKALSYWPQRFLTDPDADAVLRLFDKVVASGKHLAIMAHFTHPQELRTEVMARAVARIRETGAQIRTQSPVLRHINDSGRAWAEMWRKQADLGMVPYYMFVVRDTGAQHYFGLPLVRAWRVFRDAYQRVSGICRTVRGPSMSADPGKVQVLGVTEVNGQKVISLRFLQGRDPDWVLKPFFARYDPEATWLDELKPAFGREQFFFEPGLERLYAAEAASGQLSPRPEPQAMELLELAG
jgi:L-lysine 2,3-aminomutase